MQEFMEETFKTPIKENMQVEHFKHLQVDSLKKKENSQLLKLTHFKLRSVMCQKTIISQLNKVTQVNQDIKALFVETNEDKKFEKRTE